VNRIQAENGRHRRWTFLPRSDYVSLAEVVTAFGLRLTVDPVTHRHQVAGKGLDAALCPGMRRMLLNGRLLVLPYPVVYLDGETQIPNEVAEFFRKESPIPPVPLPPIPPKDVPIQPTKKTPKTIILDPGHGGRDPGAEGTGGLQEKEITLDVAQQLRKLLELKGHRVIMTRSGDGFPALDDRTDLCRKTQPHVFVSLHVNAAKDRSIRGFETYYRETPLKMDPENPKAPTPGDLERRMGGQSSKAMSAALPFVYDLYFDEFQSESERLAQCIHSALLKAFPEVPNRGVRKHNWHVVRWSQSAAVLVEMDFISNPGTERNMKTSKHRRKLAEALFQGLDAYLY
jgi:N-acetylmuramoyl-L-alanine amidase